MTPPKLGQLELVDIRAVWPNEAADFTPWLGSDEGLDLLKAAIELDLEARELEKPIGRFYADLVCAVPGGDKLVLVENQFGPTDHDHLGKLLTYAAALDDVVAVVWIAEHFHDEHRATLDWLNDITPQTVSFFGLEVQAWCIEASPPAPKLNVVCSPNDWSRPEPGGLTELEQLRLDFWTAFKEYLHDQGGPVQANKPGSDNWTTFRSGIKGLALLSDVKKDYLDAELYSFGGHKRLYAELQGHAVKIDAAMGEPVRWDAGSEKNASCAWVKCEADITNRAAWPAYFAWLAGRLNRLREVFAPLVAQVRAELAEKGEAEG